MPDLSQIPLEVVQGFRDLGYTDDEIAQATPPPRQQAESISAAQTIGRTAKAHAGGYIGGGAGALGGASPVLPWNAAAYAAAPETAGLSLAVPLISGIIGAGVVGYGGQKVQQAIESPETYQAQQLAAEEAAKANPKTALATDIGVSALLSGGKPSLNALRAGRGIIGKLAGVGMSGADREALVQTAMSAGVNPAINTGVSLASGQGIPSAGDLLGQAAGGAIFSKQAEWANRVTGQHRAPDEPKPEINNASALTDEVATSGLNDVVTPSKDTTTPIDDLLKNSIPKLKMASTEPKPEVTQDALPSTIHTLRTDETLPTTGTVEGTPPATPRVVAPVEEGTEGVKAKETTQEDLQKELEEFKEKDGMVNAPAKQTNPFEPKSTEATAFETIKWMNDEAPDESKILHGLHGEKDIWDYQRRFHDAHPWMESDTSNHAQKQMSDWAWDVNTKMDYGNGGYKTVEEIPTLPGWKGTQHEADVKKAFVEYAKQRREQMVNSPTTKEVSPSFGQSIVNGRATVGTALHSIANTPDHEFAGLAKEMLDKVDIDSAKSRIVMDRNITRSHYNPSTDTIHLSPQDVDHVPTIVHEAAHAAVYKKIPMEFNGLRGAKLKNAMDQYLVTGDNEGTKEVIKSYYEYAHQKGIAKKLFDMPIGVQLDAHTQEVVRGGLAGSPDMAVAYRLPYATGNLHEFISEILSNKKFQSELLNMPSGLKDKKNLWNRFTDAVCKMLGVKGANGSLLERALKATEDIVGQERPKVGLENGEIANAPRRDKSPDEQSLPPDRYMSKAGNVVRAVLDKVRDIGTPAARNLADHGQMALDKETELKGAWKNMVIQAGESLSNRDKTKLNAAFTREMETKTPHMNMLDNAAQRKFYLLARKKLDESGKHQLAIGEPITMAIKKGDKTIYVKRELKQNPVYYPGMERQAVGQIIRENKDHAAIDKLLKTFDDYNQKTLGLSKQDSMERIANWKAALQGNLKGTEISHQDIFNARRKAAGLPLPPEFRESDPVINLARYFDRAAIDAAHYEHMEKDPKVLAALGQSQDAWGKEVPQDPNGSLANTSPVKAMLEHWRPAVRNPAEYNESSISSLISSSFIAGPALELHKVVSNVVKAAANTSNPIVMVRALTRGMTHIMSGYQHALENGVVKPNAHSWSRMIAGTATAAERMQSLAGIIRKVSTLNDLTTKGGAGFVQAMNEVIIPSKVNRANQGDVSSQLFIKRLDPTYVKGKQYNDAEMQKLASRSAAYIHGTGDIRSLPAWMLNDSEFSGFFSLAHWSIAQTNNFMKEVYEPATRGDIKPLIVGMFGAAIGGYMIKELRQDIQGKKSPIPSLKEIAASDRGLEGNKGLIAYNMIAALQYAGFGGLLSQIAKYPFDDIYKNPHMGATFPMDEVASDLTETIHEATTAIANDPNLNWVDLAKAVTMHMLSSNMQMARIAINQGINNGLITGLPAEKKMLSDKMGQLRRFDMVSGLPYNEIGEGSNPYLNIEQKKFKSEQDMGKAMKELPGLIQNIFEHYSDKPDVMMNKFKALKENQYSTFPSLEQMPLSFMKYMGYLSKMEGPQAAQEQLRDYMEHKIKNEAKGSVVP